jgi:hypothetical protein
LQARSTHRQPSSFLPENISLDILYEDADLLVVNKAPGMVVHPAPGHMQWNPGQCPAMHHCTGFGGNFREPSAGHRPPAGQGYLRGAGGGQEQPRHASSGRPSSSPGRLAKNTWHWSMAFQKIVSGSVSIDPGGPASGGSQKDVRNHSYTPRTALTHWRIA